MDLQVDLERINEDEVRLHIAVDKARIDSALDAAYRKAVRRYTIPGFRPGKAPRPVFERMYGTQRLYEDALQDLVPKVYGEAVEELKLTPYEDADIEEITPAEGEGVTVKAHVLLDPEVELPDYWAYTREPLAVPEVDESQVDHAADDMRRERGTLVPSGEVALGDVVEVSGYFLDQEGQLQPFERTTIEMDRAYDAFRDALVGAHVGDERDVAPGPDDPDTRSVHLKVEDIRRIELPELTDEFAQELGHENLKEMRGWLTNALAEELSRQAEQARRNALMERIVSEANIRLPQVLVDREAHRIQHEQEHAEGAHEGEHVHDHGPADEATAERANERVRQRLVVGHLMQAEGISIRQNEFDAARAALEQRRGGQAISEADQQTLYGLLLDEKLSVFLGTLGVETPGE